MNTQSIRLLCFVATPLFLHGQSAADSPSGAVAVMAPSTVPSDPISNDRIMGVIPNFQTVNDPNTPYQPLRVRDKWNLFVKETVDPYTFASSAAGAALSQWHNTAPQYGFGAASYMQRFGAAQADVTTQNFFSDAVLASLLHEDPRYFRMGPTHRVVSRIGYALSRIVITRKDSGKESFNYSGTIGMGMGIALSNAYYPPKNVNGDEVGSRFLTSLSASALGNLLPEFWPDVRAKLERLRHR